jgi:hypothetical protein
VTSVIVASSNHTGLAGQRTVTLSTPTAVTTGASSAGNSGALPVTTVVAGDND